MNIQAIYEALFSGQTLAIELDTQGQVHTFRAKLFRYKKQQDMILMATEMIEEKQLLQIEQVDLPGGGHILRLKFADRGPRKEYRVHIIEENSSESSEQLAAEEPSDA